MVVFPPPLPYLDDRHRSCSLHHGLLVKFMPSTNTTTGLCVHLLLQPRWLTVDLCLGASTTTADQEEVCREAKKGKQEKAQVWYLVASYCVLVGYLLFVMIICSSCNLLSTNLNDALSSLQFVVGYHSTVYTGFNTKCRFPV